MPTTDNTVAKYHVSGEAPISAGTGTDGAMEFLGISRDGVNIEIVNHEVPLFSDVGGSKAPVDFQDMGHEAYISVKFVSIHENRRRLLHNLNYKMPNGNWTRTGTQAQQAAKDGTAMPRGQLIGTNGQFFKLAIGAQHEDPWYFPCVKVIGAPIKTTVGTEHQIWEYRFHAWVFITGSLESLTGLTADITTLPSLYTRVIP